MVNIELSEDEVKDVLFKRFTQKMQTVPQGGDFKSAITRISKGERFTSTTIGNAHGMKPIAAGARLKALSREGLVKKLGGGEWKRV